MTQLGGNNKAAVQLLADRAEIHDVMMRYAAAVDRRDWQLLEDCFVPDLVVLGWGDGKFKNRADLLEFIKGVAYFHTTMHMMGNQFIEVDGDTGAMDTYAMLTHHHDGPDGEPLELNMSGNRYVEKVSRRDGRWVIHQRGGEPVWSPTGVTAATTDDPAVQWLLDRAEIHDVQMHYALGIDLRDWDRIRACFADQFHATYGPLGAFTDHDKLIEFIKGVEHFDSTTHFMGTQLIEVDGDSALMETYAMITHRQTDASGDKSEWMAGPSSYVDRLVRQNGRWKIAKRGEGVPPVGAASVTIPTSDEPTVQWLLDRAEIHDVTARYALGVDRGDHELVQSCFAPGFQATFGDITVRDAGALEAHLDKYVGRWHSRHHFLNNQLIDINGDEAEVDTYAYITHRDAADAPISDWSKGARRFVDRFVRHDGRWLIKSRRLETNHVGAKSPAA